MIAQLLKGFVGILDPWQQVTEVVPVHGLHHLTCIQRTHAGGGRSAAQLPHSFLYQRLNLGKIALQYVHNAGLQVGRQVCQGQVWPSSSGLVPDASLVVLHGLVVCTSHSPQLEQACRLWLFDNSIAVQGACA